MARGRNEAYNPNRQPERPWSGGEPVVGKYVGSMGNAGDPSHRIFLSAEATGGGQTDSLTFPHFGRQGGYQDLVGKHITMKPSGTARLDAPGGWLMHSYDPKEHGGYHGAPPPSA